jgi:uncharacterized protein (DUF1800 family)
LLIRGFSPREAATMALREIPAALDQVDPAWAWAEYVPDDDRAWSRELAAHLYRRAAFGANWRELDAAVEAGPGATVDRLLAGGDDTTAFYEDAERTIRPLLSSGGSAHLPAWWLRVMLDTPHPLLERLTLFWHGHFATSAAKVTEAKLMHQQHALLRRHALGHFGPLLAGMARDPAMLLWLDSATNRKSHPNENFAREVMELFSLGLGNYTEVDIREAARAFTGWEVRRGEFRFNPLQHDAQRKQVLGDSGVEGGDDVIRVLLEQPATARFLVGKLYRALISETAAPPAALVEPLAAGYRQRDYDTAWLVGTLLRSNLFYSPHAQRQRIKGPVEFAVGMLRGLEATVNTYALADDLLALGQGVFFPPNVKGWDGGTDWINSATLLGRANLAWALVGGADPRYAARVALPGVVSRHAGRGPAEQAAFLEELLLGRRAPDAVHVQLVAIASDPSSGEPQRLARLAQAIATLPEFHVS